MTSVIDDLKNQGLIEKEKIGFEKIISHTHRLLKDLKVAEANLDIDTDEEPGILISLKQTEEALKGANEFVKMVAKIIQEKNPQEKLI